MILHEQKEILNDAVVRRNATLCFSRDLKFLLPEIVDSLDKESKRWVVEMACPIKTKDGRVHYPNVDLIVALIKAGYPVTTEDIINLSGVTQGDCDQLFSALFNPKSEDMVDAPGTPCFPMIDTDFIHPKKEDDDEPSCFEILWRMLSGAGRKK